MQPGDVIPYLQMCQAEGVSLQRGMNFRLRDDVSVILMSVRPGAPYADRVEEDGRVVVYEGHDVPKSADTPDPKSVDLVTVTPSGRKTQNGLFYDAGIRFAGGQGPPELVRVYEKIRQGVWVYNGVFILADAWFEKAGGRTVCKFRLELTNDDNGPAATGDRDIPQTRVIPTEVKLEVWQRDGGRCVTCGSSDNLHFDHIIPYSRGGSSLVAENIQLLCARHNLQKHDRIE